MAIRIGTAEPRSTFHIQGMALAEILLDAGEDARVLETPGASIGNARRLGEGEIDLGFMAANWVGLAGRGEPPFAQPIELRLVAPMNAGPLFFVTRADRPLETIAAIRGKRVAVGPETSGMHQHTRSILGALGIGFESFTPVHLDFAQGAKALANGEVDVQFQSPVPNPIMDDLAHTTPVRAVAPSREEIETVVGAIPHYRRTVLAKGAFAGHDRDTDQIGVLNVLVTHRRVEDERVGAVVAALVGGQRRLMEIEPLFRGLDGLLEDLSGGGVERLESGRVPFHPGALLAYRRAGLLPEG